MPSSAFLHLSYIFSLLASHLFSQHQMRIYFFFLNLSCVLSTPDESLEYNGQLVNTQSALLSIPTANLKASASLKGTSFQPKSRDFLFHLGNRKRVQISRDWPLFCVLRGCIKGRVNKKKWHSSKLKATNRKIVSSRSWLQVLF
jgi:hypothetical protein